MSHAVGATYERRTYEVHRQENDTWYRCPPGYSTLEEASRAMARYLYLPNNLRGIVDTDVVPPSLFRLVEVRSTCHVLVIEPSKPV